MKTSDNKPRKAPISKTCVCVCVCHLITAVRTTARDGQPISGQTPPPRGLPAANGVRPAVLLTFTDLRLKRLPTGWAGGAIECTWTDHLL